MSGVQGAVSVGGEGSAKDRGTGLTVFRKAQKAHDPEDIERWEETSDAATLDNTANSTRTANAVLSAGVRRLTPVECCRLQSFPDDWLGEPNTLPDSPRYAAMGDAVTVNVAEWIGARLIAEVSA